MNGTNDTENKLLTRDAHQIHSFVINTQYLVLIFSIVSNSLLLLFLFTRGVRFSFVDRLMVNSVVCNLSLVLLGIPTTLRINASTTYPFSDLGCKLINPLSTCFVNCTVFVYVVVAWERWLVVSRFRYSTSTTQMCTIILSLNTIGFLFVVPYIITSYTSTDEDGVTHCKERWNTTWREVYTLVLFVIQYGVPVPMMTVLYTKTWLVIYQMNRNVVVTDLNDDQSLTSRRATECSRNGDQYEMDANSCKKSRTMTIQTIGSEDRNQQTRGILIRFTTIMVVFAVCQLPNHILWLLVDFTEGGEEFFSPLVHDVAYFMTYANCVANPLIYGQYGKEFRDNLLRAYRRRVQV